MGEPPQPRISDTAVAELITELILFEPEVCIRNGH